MYRVTLATHIKIHSHAHQVAHRI